VHGGGGFFENKVWAAQAIAAGVAAVLSGGIAAFAIGFRRERSVLALLAVLVGLFVLIFSIAELAGGG
jgi:hypothetical protein